MGVLAAGLPEVKKLRYVGAFRHPSRKVGGFGDGTAFRLIGVSVGGGAFDIPSPALPVLWSLLQVDALIHGRQ